MYEQSTKCAVQICTSGTFILVRLASLCVSSAYIYKDNVLLLRDFLSFHFAAIPSRDPCKKRMLATRTKSRFFMKKKTAQSFETSSRMFHSTTCHDLKQQCVNLHCSDKPPLSSRNLSASLVEFTSSKFIETASVIPVIFRSDELTGVRNNTSSFADFLSTCNCVI